MAIPTLEEQLTTCQAAILKAEESKQYSIKDRSMERQDIQHLYSERTRLLLAITKRDARVASGGIRSRRFTA